MKLWRKAAGAIKDKNSIWLASLSRQTPYRHPDLEAAIIRATSHDASRIDYRNARRVFEWIRTSPIYLKPLAWGLSSRMDKTRCWVVALKGLMLIHGVLCCQIPAVQRIGRLPFDLSGFKDAYSGSAHDAFVRTYYAYLDQKSVFVSRQAKNAGTGTGPGPSPSPPLLLEQLLKLQTSQSMLDVLLQVRPLDQKIKTGLVLEAMNNLVVEVCDLYSRICNGIAQVLLQIHASSPKTEASMALRIVQKAAAQVEDLSEYFALCKEMGVLKASDYPKLEKIPEEDIKELEQVINGSVSGKRKSCEVEEEKIGNNNNNNNNNIVMRERENGRGEISENRNGSKRSLKTVITDKWEIFDGDYSSSTTATTFQVPFAACSNSKPNYKLDLPDLITF